MRREGLRAPPYRSIALFESVRKRLCATSAYSARPRLVRFWENSTAETPSSQRLRREKPFSRHLFSGLGLGWAPYSGSRAVRDEADGNRYE